jgi:hypothetical protein
MSMLAEIEQGLGKTPYQTYILAVGLDLITVEVPLSQTDSFEQALKEENSPRGTRLTVVKQLIAAHNGLILEV